MRIFKTWSSCFCSQRVKYFRACSGSKSSALVWINSDKIGISFGKALYSLQSNTSSINSAMQLAEVAMDSDNWHSSANVWTNFAKVMFIILYFYQHLPRSLINITSTNNLAWLKKLELYVRFISILQMYISLMN